MVLSEVPQKKSSVTPPGIDPGTVRLIAQRLNHYATPGVRGDPCGAMHHKGHNAHLLHVLLPQRRS